MIRPVRPEDAAAVAAIYAPYVADTAVSFEEVAPAPAEMAARIAAATATHPWLVAERDGTVAGYAYGRPFHPRAAYRWAAETGIYLARGARGGGLGRSLYMALLDALTAQGFVTALALITEPNAESTGFHAALGFARVGLARGVGYKGGRWYDVGYWQRDLGDRPAAPREPHGR